VHVSTGASASKVSASAPYDNCRSLSMEIFNAEGKRIGQIAIGYYDAPGKVVHEFIHGGYRYTSIERSGISRGHFTHPSSTSQ